MQAFPEFSFPGLSGEESTATEIATVTAATVIAALLGKPLTIVQSSQNNVSGKRILISISERTIITFSGFGPISTNQNLIFTLKDNILDSDASAIVVIDRTVGLKIINGATASTPAHGSISVLDADNGDGTIILSELETANISPRDQLVPYGVKTIDPALGPRELSRGHAVISYDVGRQLT